MEATETYESWNPTSKSDIGWIISNTQAVKARVFSVTAFRLSIWKKIRKVSITAERTTEADIPTKTTKLQMAISSTKAEMK